MAKAKNLTMNSNFKETVLSDGQIKGGNYMSAEIEKALDLIRPGLQADGGNVEFVEVSADGVVKVRLTGACGHCPMSAQTLKFGVEKTLKQHVPSVTSVVSV